MTAPGAVAPTTPRRRTSAGARGTLWGIVLALTVAGAAVRAPALAEGTVPAPARSAVVACLAIFCAQAIAGLVVELRRT